MAATDQDNQGELNIVALDKDGNVIERRSLPMAVYFQGPDTYIGDEEYLAKRGIRQILGHLYDADDEILSAFVAYYSKTGRRYGGSEAYTERMFKGL